MHCCLYTRPPHNDQDNNAIEPCNPSIKPTFLSCCQMVSDLTSPLHKARRSICKVNAHQMASGYVNINAYFGDSPITVSVLISRHWYEFCSFCLYCNATFESHPCSRKTCQVMWFVNFCSFHILFAHIATIRAKIMTQANQSIK